MSEDERKQIIEALKALDGLKKMLHSILEANKMQIK